MKSYSNSRTVVVGIFISLGLVILIITILILGSQRKTFDKSILVKSFFENVNGLQKGNNVWFSGVKAGTIKTVKITGNGQVEVDMNIDQATKQFIRKDSKAKISTDGLIGNKIIEIYGGSLKLPEIEDGDVLYTDKLLSMDAMMSTLSLNNDNLLQITNDFKTISSRLAQGKGTIGKLLNDETTIDQLNQTMVTLQTGVQNFQTLSVNLNKYTANLNKKGTLANDLMTDTVMFKDLRGTVAKLHEVVNLSRKAIINFENAGNTLNGAMESKNTPIGMFLKDEKTADQIKVTLQYLKDASKKLDEDLEALQHNIFLRGFFKKKAKENESMRVVLDTLVSE